MCLFDSSKTNWKSACYRLLAIPIFLVLIVTVTNPFVFLRIFAEVTHTHINDTPRQTLVCSVGCSRVVFCLSVCVLQESSDLGAAIPISSLSQRGILSAGRLLGAQLLPVLAVLWVLQVSDE